MNIFIVSFKNKNEELPDGRFELPETGNQKLVLLAHCFMISLKKRKSKFDKRDITLLIQVLKKIAMNAA